MSVCVVHFGNRKKIDMEALKVRFERLLVRAEKQLENVSLDQKFSQIENNVSLLRNKSDYDLILLIDSKTDGQWQHEPYRILAISRRFATNMYSMWH